MSCRAKYEDLLSTRDPTFVKPSRSDDEDCFSQSDMQNLLRQLQGEIVERTKVVHEFEKAKTLHETKVSRVTNALRESQLQRRQLEEQLEQERTKRVQLENKYLSKKIKDQLHKI